MKKTLHTPLLSPLAGLLLLALLIGLPPLALAQTQTFEATGGDQTYNVTANGTVTLTARGAEGINISSGPIKTNGSGSGATVTATFPVQAGDVLTVVVGVKGGGKYIIAGGGGGGSAVILNRSGTPTLLLVAGGGGGAEGNKVGGGASAADGVAGGGERGDRGGGLGGAGGGGFNEDGGDKLYTLDPTPNTGGKAGTLSGGGAGGGDAGGFGFGGGGDRGSSTGGGGGGGYGGGNGGTYSKSSTGGSSFVQSAGIVGTDVIRIDGTDGGGTERDGQVIVTFVEEATDFAILSVSGLSCMQASPPNGPYDLSFTPDYQDTDGNAITFRAVNESLPTTNPGPYTLELYPDNPVIHLEAKQSGATATYRFAWLDACRAAQGGTTNRPPTSTPIPDQSIPQGQAYQLDLSAYSSDPDGQALTFSATGLPAGLSISGSSLTGTPTTAGTSTVSITARDPGNLTATASFMLTVSATPPPTGGPLRIASVNTIECRELTQYSRQLTFTPVYAGGDGSLITFQIRNESLPTTAGGPYSLRVYTDNPTLTLLASQAGSPQVAYAYNWLAACGSSAARMSAENSEGATSLRLSVRAYPNPVLDAVTVQVLTPSAGETRFELVDMQGNVRQRRREYLSEGRSQVELRLGSLPGGMYLIRAVDAWGQQATVKINKQ